MAASPDDPRPYSIRVRDLVHGFVYLTGPERDLIQHPLFQRLRHVRQNDVAFFVYPSLNISRFEHSLGTAHVAGKIALNLHRGRQWNDYAKAASISPAEFEQICRLYALLHDVGHLPLSHLFEMAVRDFLAETAPDTPLADSLKTFCSDWFGASSFTKPHEACGSIVSRTILDETPNIPPAVRDAVLHLMNHKTLEAQDPLAPIKALLDSEIDADRIDSTARDGVLAGGEYGNYDIDRLCSATFLRCQAGEWGLAYSHKAIGSIEALLLDRCRNHTWIHFHHRVVALKVALQVLIKELLVASAITATTFAARTSDILALRDDIWLWSLLRERRTVGSGQEALNDAARAAVFHRDGSRVVLLWKHRSEYRAWWHPALRSADMREDTAISTGRRYEQHLSAKLGVPAFVYVPSFEALGKRAIHLCDDDGNDLDTRLADESILVQSLSNIWGNEPAFYVVLLNVSANALDGLREKWVSATAEWIRAGQA